MDTKEVIRIMIYPSYFININRKTPVYIDGRKDEHCDRLSLTLLMWITILHCS